MTSLALEQAYHQLPGSLRRLIEPEMFRQLVRFIVSGVAVTLLSASLYLLLVYGAARNPFVATGLSHAAGLAAAYALHSRWSFASTEQRSEIATLCRFLTVSSCCFGLNNLWVALTTVLFGLPMWTPVPLMIFVTPVVSFLLNRFWVFRAHRGETARTA